MLNCFAGNKTKCKWINDEIIIMLFMMGHTVLLFIVSYIQFFIHRRYTKFFAPSRRPNQTFWSAEFAPWARLLAFLL